MKLATLGFAFVAAFAFAVGAIELTDLEIERFGLWIWTQVDKGVWR